MIPYFTIADTHVGGRTDFWALESTIRKACKKLLIFGYDRATLVILGDVHDNQGIYKTQYTILNAVWQPLASAAMIEWIVETIKEEGVKIEKVAIVEGNHDVREAEG